MIDDTTRHIKQCEGCLRFKALPENAPIENVDATYPMELVHMDYLMIEANEGGKDVHILVITDHFTWYAQAIITSSQTAKCTAQKELCEIAEVKKIRTLGYHSQTNGQCEYFNATLINMLGTLPEKPKSTWREQVPTLGHAFNCTRNNVTGFSPYYLMFG